MEADQSLRETMNRDNLIKSLSGCDFDGIIEGPKGDIYHHIQSVDIIQGNDDYIATSIATVKADAIHIDKTDLRTPNRPRAMGGIVITIWSEEFYLWSRQILFHKGGIYQSDTIIEENVDLYAKEKEEEDDPQLSLDLQ
jgi:hypothetical protein